MTAEAEDLTEAGGPPPAVQSVRSRRRTWLREQPERAPALERVDEPESSRGSSDRVPSHQPASGRPRSIPRAPAAPALEPATSEGEQSSPQPSLPQRCTELARQRPELGLGAAFLGGLLLATILKRLGRR